MTWLNYHHLFYFWTIAKEGSIAKASQKLRLGQPTLSLQLKQLEDSMGKALFERRNRSLVLTENGKVAFDYANEIFRLGSEMLEAMQDRLSRSVHHVQIGALDSVPKQFLQELSRQALTVGPCVISLLEGKGDELFRELEAHRLDLLIMNYPPTPEAKNRYFARSIARLPVGVYGAKSFLKLKKGFPQSLQGQDFILPTWHSKLRQDLDHFFKSQEIAMNPVIETQDTSLQTMLGSSGLGLVPLSRAAAGDLLREKKLFEIGKIPNVIEEVWLVSSSRRIENPIASQLLEKFKLSAAQ